MHLWLDAKALHQLAFKMQVQVTFFSVISAVIKHISVKFSSTMMTPLPELSHLFQHLSFGQTLHTFTSIVTHDKTSQNTTNNETKLLIPYQYGFKVTPCYPKNNNFFKSVSVILANITYFHQSCNIWSNNQKYYK